MSLGKAEKAVMIFALALLAVFAAYTAVNAVTAPELAISAAEFPAPARAEIESGGGETALININKAAVEELVSLPSVGEVLALRIIQYREEHGRFAVIEDIMNVQGIGEAKYEKLADLITVEDTAERAEEE